MTAGEGPESNAPRDWKHGDRRENPFVSKLHLVFGGRVSDPQTLDFENLESLDVVGFYEDYAAAVSAWRGAAQRTVDDAQMKYVVVHLHRLLEPEAL